jgi:hypothetical protein
VLLAAALTVVIVLGYGAYAGWNALTGGGSGSDTEATAETGYLASVDRAMFFGGAVLGAGTDVRLVGDLGNFLDQANQAIYTVGVEQGNVDKAARNATGARADVLASTTQSLDNLRVAMIRWRDAVFNLRLGLVADAKADVESAIAQLRADAERWKALPG